MANIATRTTGTAVRIVFYYKQPGKVSWTRETCTRNNDTGEFNHSHKGLIADGSYKYQVSYQLDGKTKYRTIDNATYSNVSVLARDVQAALLALQKVANVEQRSAGRPAEGIRKTVKAHKLPGSITGAAERFLSLKETRQGRNVSGKQTSSYRNSKQTVDLFVSVCHARKVYHVSNIDNGCLKAWVDEAQGKWGAGTVAKRFRDLQGFLSAGKRKSAKGHGLGLNMEGLMTDINVTDPNRTGSAARKEIFTDSEIASMRQAAGDLTRDRITLELTLQLGLRASEVLNSQWQCAAQPGVYHVLPHDSWRGKSDAALRAIPMSPSLKKMIDEYRKVSPCNESDFILCNKFGNLEPINTVLARVARKAGIKSNYNPHKFRHTFLTKMVNSGANIFEVKNWAGHESLETLEIYYKHKAASDYSAMMEGLI